NLRLVEIGHHRVGTFLVRHAAHLCTPVDVFGTVLADEAGQSMNGGQPLVASRNAAVSGSFDVTEKVSHQLRRHVDHRESIHWLVQVDRYKGNEQAQGIAVTAPRVAGEVAFADQVLEQESPDPRS